VTAPVSPLWLKPLHYEELAWYIMCEVQQATGFGGHWSTDDSSRTITLTWNKRYPDTPEPDEPELRLIMDYQSNGFYPTLYRGSGNDRVGEGRVHTWSIFQERLAPRRRALRVSGLNWLLPDAERERYELHLAHPFTDHLPGRDPDAPSVIDDIALTVQLQRGGEHQTRAA
jgi:hypothetical protein